MSVLNLINFLEEKGISQAELARRLGVAPQTLNRMLLSDDIKWSNIVKIADVLDVSVAAIIGFDDAEVKKQTSPYLVELISRQQTLIESQQRSIDRLTEIIQNLSNKA